jgi:adenosine/AMP kinase
MKTNGPTDIGFPELENRLFSIQSVHTPFAFGFDETAHEYLVQISRSSDSLLDIAMGVCHEIVARHSHVSCAFPHVIKPCFTDFVS